VVNRLRYFAENAEKESNRLRATELLGKSVSLFVEQVEAHVTHNVQAEAHRQTAVEAEGRVLDS